MTSLLSPPQLARTDAAHRRPLWLLAPLAGVVAAGSVLLVCLAAGVAGWFLTDAGAHGVPHDGLRIGALAWLMAHGSGVHVAGVSVTAVPLGLSLVSALVVWRLGLRLGDSVSGHGPDADRIADGERDWTVPAATLLMVLGYAVVVVLTGRLATTPATAPAVSSAVVWSVVLCGLLGGSAIAVGSGRAAIWTAFLPMTVRAAAAGAWRTLRLYAVASLLVFLVALVTDWGSAANVMSQLHTSPGEAALIVAISALVVPNAVVCTGSYLLGPGFAVGAHTVVSPTAVVLGPLPMFPLLAALPGDGPTPGWTVALLAVPPVAAFVAAARTQHLTPTRRWEEAGVRGCASGLLAGLVFAVLAWLTTGAVGPGRMQDVGPLVFQTLLHGLVAFGLGGLLGALAMLLWQRRRGTV